MRNMLLLRANPSDDQRWSWLHLDTTGVAQGVIHSGPLVDATTEADGMRVLVLMPGTDCLLTSVRIPGRNRKKLLQAVPYALEERLSDDVEKLHFAIGAELDDGGRQVVVIDKHRMETLMAELGEAGLDVQCVVPEQLAVPLFEGGDSVLVDHDMAVVRSGENSGHAVDKDNLGMVLSAREQDDSDLQPVLQLYLEQDASVPELGDYPGEIRIEHYARDPLVILSKGLDMKAINLLQGEFGPVGEWAGIWHPLRATAALLLAGVLISNVVMGVDYYHLDKESDQLKTQIEGIFKKTFPETRRLVNPRAQMQQKLDQLQNTRGTGNHFLNLIGQAGVVIKDTKGVEITGANFRGGRLDLDLKVTDLQLLDQLKQDLIKTGVLSVEIQSATTESDQHVQSRLRIMGVDT